MMEPSVDISLLSQLLSRADVALRTNLNYFRLPKQVKMPNLC
jgi:hypothetical protein